MSIGPQLSSVSTALNELTSRVAALADQQVGDRDGNVANALFEIERSLATAGRRLEQLVADLR